MTRPLSDTDVWTFMQAGCNAEEIAAFAGVSRMVAVAMMNRACHVFSAKAA